MTTQQWIRLMGLMVIAFVGACSQENGDEQASAGSVAADKSTSGKRTGADRNACDLLTVEEVSAAAGEPVTAKEINRETGRSDCEWNGADGLLRLGLVGYWTGGKEGWDILVGARAAAKDIIQKEEGVALDSVVKSGPVAGLGDKAIFSDILPSMVLKDNVLLEFTMPILHNAAAKFRPLATKALSRL
jgi:hypothetical protein